MASTSLARANLRRGCASTRRRATDRQMRSHVATAALGLALLTAGFSLNGFSDDEPDDAGSGGGGNTVAQDRLPELRAEAPPPCRAWCDERVARCGKDEASCLSTCTWSLASIPESCGPSASKFMECEAEIDPAARVGRRHA